MCKNRILTFLELDYSDTFSEYLIIPKRDNYITHIIVAKNKNLPFFTDRYKQTDKRTGPTLSKKSFAFKTQGKYLYNWTLSYLRIVA